MGASSVAGNAVLSRVKQISAVFHAILATASLEMDKAIQPGKQRMCHSHSLEYVTKLIIITVGSLATTFPLQC